jgi:hypothetical protein
MPDLKESNRTIPYEAGVSPWKNVIFLENQQEILRKSIDELQIL